MKMIAYFGNDVRRINHALKVLGFATAISKSENLNNHYKEIIEISAILHDIGIPNAEMKFGSCIGKYQELEGPPVAREIMRKAGIKEEIIERVCYIIGNHHTYTKIDDIDFQVLVEADFLVNIDEDNMTKDMIQVISKKYFKSHTGIEILNNLYLKN
jgi:HD superfamily phosphodiesterase